MCRRCNSRNALVCRAWTHDATMEVWRDVGFPVFRSLVPSIIGPHGTVVCIPLCRLFDYQFTDANHVCIPKRLLGRPSPEHMERFRRRCSRARSFADDAYDEQPLLSSSALAGVFRGRRPLFPNITDLMVQVTNLRPPITSPSVINLTVLISRPLHGDDYLPMCSNMHHAPTHLPNVETLRVDGDDHLETFHRPLARLCTAFPKLRTLILAPSALSPALLLALSEVGTLVTVHVLECARSYELGYTFQAGAPIRGPIKKLADGCFPVLKNFSFTSGSVDTALSLLCMPTYPSHNLVFLWIKFPSGSYFEPGQVQELLKSAAGVCVSLESLTLRFGSYSKLQQDPFNSIPQLTFSDIRDFLLFPRLKRFYIDHYLSISISEEDLDRLSRCGSRLEELWLNPFPYVHPTSLSGGMPSPGWLSRIARGCPCLRRLGMAMDTRGFELDGSEVHVFKELQDLFVGSSLINMLRNGDDARCSDWESLAVFFFKLLGSRGRLVVIEEQDEAEILMLESTGMRARGPALLRGQPELEIEAHAWRVVIGLIMFLRDNGRRRLAFI